MTPLLRITVVLVAVVACKGADAVTRPAAGPTGQVAPPAQQAAAALAKTLAADSLWAGIVRVTQGGYPTVVHCTVQLCFAPPVAARPPATN